MPALERDAQRRPAAAARRAGTITRLTPPRPRLRDVRSSAARLRARRRRRSTTSAIGDARERRCASSIQPRGVASAASMRLKSIGVRSRARSLPDFAGLRRDRRGVASHAGALRAARQRLARRRSRRSRGGAAASRSVGPVSSAMPARASSAAASPRANAGCAARNASTIGLVLLGQHAAGRVDEAAARLHQRRRGGEDRALLARRARRAPAPAAAT